MLINYTTKLLHSILGAVVTYFAFVHDVFILQLVCILFLGLTMLGLCSNEIDHLFEEQNALSFIVAIPFMAFGYWCYFWHGHPFFGSLAVLTHIVMYGRTFLYKIRVK